MKRVRVMEAMDAIYLNNIFIEEVPELRKSLHLHNSETVTNPVSLKVNTALR